MDRIEGKTRYELDAHRGDYSYNVVVYMTQRQASWLTASLVIVVGLIFIAGYFGVNTGYYTSRKLLYMQTVYCKNIMRNWLALELCIQLNYLPNVCNEKIWLLRL